MILNPQQIALMRLGLPKTPCNGSDGGSGPSQQTVTQTNLPEYARPYFERLMARTEGTSNEGYVPYNAPRVQGFTPMQNQAMSNISNMQEPGQIRDATNLTGIAAQGSLGNAGYTSQRIGSTYNPQATQMFQAPSKVQNQNVSSGEVQSNFRPGQFDARSAAQYMDPYQQGVTDIAKREATRNYQQQNVARDATSVQRGSFGGSRAALVQQEAARNHAQELNDIQTKGNESAYQNAQQQFERDRGAGYQATQQQLDAGKTNVGNSLNAQQFNATQGLGAQQFNAQQQMAYGQTGLSNQQYNEGQRQQAAAMGMQGQVADEQARQSAAGIRNQSYGQAGSLAGQLGTLGQAQQDLALKRNAALYEGGAQQQALNQKILDTDYDNFVNQRDYEKQNLAFYSGIMRGVPATTNSDVKSTGTQGNSAAQLAGLGIAGLGAYNAYKG